MNIAPKRVSEAYYRYYEMEKEFGNDFVNVEKVLPLEFDLVNVVTDHERTLNGWFDGRIWKSRKLRKNEKVIAWKKVRPSEFGF